MLYRPEDCTISFHNKNPTTLQASPLSARRGGPMKQGPLNKGTEGKSETGRRPIYRLSPWPGGSASAHCVALSRWPRRQATGLARVSRTGKPLAWVRWSRKTLVDRGAEVPKEIGFSLHKYKGRKEGALRAGRGGETGFAGAKKKLMWALRVSGRCLAELKKLDFPSTTGLR